MWRSNTAGHTAVMNRLPALAAELVTREPVAVLVSTGGTVSALFREGFHKRDHSGSVHDLADDPVKVGLVDRLNRPGGNVTGITDRYRNLAPKRIGAFA